MLYNHYTFFIFFAGVLALNFALLRFVTARKIMLIAASLLFFLSWGGADVALFVVMLVLNYPLARALYAADGRPRDQLLTLSLLLNIGALAYFKYYFFLLVHVLGIPVLPASPWAPLALSFYTFHILSFHIDLHRRECTPGRFIDYAAYISFFPHLIAGPIVRCLQLRPQFEEPLPAARFDWAGGLLAFSIGFFLKCSADLIAITTDPHWQPAGVLELSTADAWTTAFLFSCQIFGDFAGYSYMAIGLARLLGYELPVNFNAPYLAASFREFWQRWHITLSRFLRDYLYILALGGNRMGRARAHFNTMVTMLIGGLWHGANWTFVIWGGIHGAALVLERLLGLDDRAQRTFLVRAAWYCVVQIVVVLAWVQFRAPDPETATFMMHRMFDFTDGFGIGAAHLSALALSLPVIGYHLVRFVGERARLESPAAAGVVSAMLLVSGLVLLNRPIKFIYFEF